MLGFLEKTGDTYQLTAESSVFLSKRSQAYLGGTLEFLCTPELLKNFSVLSETIRRGTVAADRNTVSDANPIWVQFARAMVPMMMPAAQAIADLLAVQSADLDARDVYRDPQRHARMPAMHGAQQD